jgi:hypothetical protein
MNNKIENTKQNERHGLQIRASQNDRKIRQVYPLARYLLYNTRG